jgi:hypothetical protein
MGQNPPPSAGAPPDGGPEGLEKVSVSWLILQRLEDITKRLDAVDRRFEAMDQRFEAVERRFEAVDRRFEEVERRLDSFLRLWQWTIGLLFAIIIGTIVKLLIPGA